jgi:hypothetical protein
MNTVLFRENRDKISKNELEKNELNNIYLFNQYYIDKDSTRLTETRLCLKLNISLRIFKNIYLLNEKIYTKEELDLPENEMSNITQVDIKKRLTYSDVLEFVKSNNINGYIVIANSDIFFDNSMTNIRKSSISTKKGLYALSRFEYFNEYGNNLNKCKLVKQGYCSQDVWIFHTNFLLSDEEERLCDFELGRVGCDNKIAYLFDSFGFTVYNHPNFIKTYHNHSNQTRNTVEREKLRIPTPYLLLPPINCL